MLFVYVVTRGKYFVRLLYPDFKSHLNNKKKKPTKLINFVLVDVQKRKGEDESTEEHLAIIVCSPSLVNCLCCKV